MSIPAQNELMGTDSTLAPTMAVVVGLGNPGERYAGTRHNVGYDTVEELARRWRLTWRPESARFLSTGGRQPRSGPVLVKPLTFMNRSGIAVEEVMQRRRIDANQILVVHDDLDLAVGRLRLAARGSSGGHRGLQSIIEHTGSTAFARIKVGIGRPRQFEPIESYVLEPPYAEDLAEHQAAIQRAADAVELVLSDGLSAAMNRFNRRREAPQGPTAAARDARK